jgi:dihydrofolate synthase/folylpolyglutamate synthase
MGVRLQLRGHDFRDRESGDGTWDYQDARGVLGGLPVPALEGVAQIGNAATALAAVRELTAQLPLSRASIERALREVRLPGRFQRIAGRGGVEWVLDVAHNPDAAAVLAASLARHPCRGRTFAVCGMLADKDVAAVISALRGSVDVWIAATTAGPRGLSDAALADRAEAAGVTMTLGREVPAAMELASGAARAGDRIVVFGSFHTVGPALACV